MGFRFLPLSWIALLLPVPVWGQAVPSREPSSTHIFPAGGKRGTIVQARVGGECFPPGMNFKMIGAGVKGPEVLGPEVKPRYEPSLRRLPRDADGVGANMSYPREFAATLTLADDAKLGEHFWRVSGGWGGTQWRPFLIGDLPEFIETEPNSDPLKAERVTLPIVVNGQIAGERDQDFFVFAARVGEVVICDVMASRIGSPLEPVIAITDASGKRMDMDEARVGNDPVVAFRAPKTGDYRLHVANLGFSGGPAFVYRITITTRPYALFAFPPGGRAGETLDFDLFTLAGVGSLVSNREKITLPNQLGAFALRDGLRLNVGEGPEMVEQGNHQTFKTAMELTTPITVSARFSHANEEDWFRFAAKKGEAFTLACQPFPAHSAAVPILTLVDATGATLAKAHGIDNPDHGFDLEWRAPADGDYRLRLRDLQFGSRGGPEFIYRLTVRPSRPDFSLRLDSDQVNVVQGGKTEIDLWVQRLGGFIGPIDLRAVGLPAGVKMEPERITDQQKRIKLSFSAKDDIRPADVAVAITGHASMDKKAVERPAAVVSFGKKSPALHLTVQHKPVFKLSCNEAYQYAHRGSIYPYLMKVERLDGFNGPITLQLADRQVQDLDGIDIVETVVPPGAKEAKNLIFLPETMHASVQHHSRPYAQAYASFTDKWGQKQTLLAVSQHRCMVRTLPPVVKLRAVTKELAVRSGESAECTLALDRTSAFTGAAELTLVGSLGYVAEVARIGPDQKAVVIRVRVGDAVRAATEGSLRFRATAQLPSGAIAVTETTIPVRLR